uniref:Uncharacterized protein n=1 Tax=Arundo donax TaxID=35708 RepID=A0A0A8ZNV1_ARUDO
MRSTTSEILCPRHAHNDQGLL